MKNIRYHIAIVYFFYAATTHAAFFDRCRLAYSATLDISTLATDVIRKALNRREQLQEIPYGEVWGGYLENLSKIDLKKPAEGNRPVPLKGEVKEVIEFMQQKVKDFQEEIANPALPNSLKLKPIQKEVLLALDKGLSATTDRETIQRAELYKLAQLFAIASTQQIYLRQDRTKNYTSWGDTAEEVIRGSNGSISEANLDRYYGITALPLPTREHLGFRGFLQMEGMGIIPLGVTTNVEKVDGGELDPMRFFEHDEGHFIDRMGMLNDRIPVSVIVKNKNPIDLVLSVGMEKALSFSVVLDKKIQELPNRRRQVLAQGIVFYIIHEERKTYGVLDFNSTYLKRRARSILGQKRKRQGSDIISYHDLVRRLQNNDDLGQAFRKKPTSAEIDEILAWLGAISVG